jgi:hypothetical protein
VPQYRHAVSPPCGSPGMSRGRTSTSAVQANAVMRRRPDCSEGRRRLAARSPHGYEQRARTTDATGREPPVPRSCGRYLVALYNTARPHAALGNRPPAARLRQLQLLGSTEGTVAPSRPASINDRCDGPGQGSPKATGGSRRAASLRRPATAVTLAQRRDPCLIY